MKIIIKKIIILGLFLLILPGLINAMDRDDSLVEAGKPGLSAGAAGFNKAPMATTISRHRYNLLPLTIAIVIFYFFTRFLVKKKIICPLTHQRLWNVVLLISFLASAILGLFLIIRINLGWDVPLPFNMLYWHVEAGIVMAVISIFHIACHWRYFTCMVKRRKSPKI